MMANWMLSCAVVSERVNIITEQLVMCFCVCSLPRAFVERQTHDQSQDIIVGITTFSDVCTERVVFMPASRIDKLIIVEQHSPDASAAWSFFRNVQLIDILVFLDEPPNLFEIPAPPLPNAAGGEAVSFEPTPAPPPSPSTSYAQLTPVSIQSPDPDLPPSYDEIYHYHFHRFSPITVDSDSDDDDTGDSGLETN